MLFSWGLFSPLLRHLDGEGVASSLQGLSDGGLRLRDGLPLICIPASIRVLAPLSWSLTCLQSLYLQWFHCSPLASVNLLFPESYIMFS